MKVLNLGFLLSSVKETQNKGAGTEIQYSSYVRNKLLFKM